MTSDNIETSFITTQPHPRYTFENNRIREWVEERLHGRVLNPCAGQTTLEHSDKIVRNDINEEMPADTHVDVTEIPKHYDESSFDTVIFDPPWSLYQSNLRYDGNHITKDEISIDPTELPQTVDSNKTQIGHARLAKDGFDYLLREGGTVIQLAYTGSCMPNRLGYDRIERVMFDPFGEGKTMIASVDEKQ